MFSFKARKKIVDFQPFIRRICDLTTPNRRSVYNEALRDENRYNRTIPVLLCPWVNEEAVHTDCTWGVTKDVSDQGAGLVLNHECLAEAVVIGIWVSSDDMSEPWFFIANTQRTVPIGAGFWQLGVEFTELANESYGRELKPLLALASRLLPSPYS